MRLIGANEGGCVESQIKTRRGRGMEDEEWRVSACLLAYWAAQAELVVGVSFHVGIAVSLLVYPRSCSERTRDRIGC